MKKEYRVKEVRSTNGAYVHMDILKNGGGKFYLDDRMGWMWSGDDESFLLGILRVGGSDVVADEFYKKLEASDVTKADIKRAILHSLDKDPKDGLFSLIGDNVAYEGGSDDSNDDPYWADLTSCLENNFNEEDTAKEIAADIIEKSTENVPGSREIFNKYENKLAKNYTLQPGGKSWKHFVKNNIVAGCDHEGTAKAFMRCVYYSLEQEKENIREGFDEHRTNAIMNATSISDAHLKELAEKYNIHYKVIEHCAHGGSETLEEFRPIWSWDKDKM